MMLMVQTSEYKIPVVIINMNWPHKKLNVDVHVFILFAKLFMAINNHFLETSMTIWCVY